MPIIRSEKSESEAVFPGEKSLFYGFSCYDFQLNDVTCRVVVPKICADGKPWVWRARFFGVEPQFDLAMLKQGYHVVTCDVSDLFGNAEAVSRWDRFYEYLRFEHLFADRAVLEGFSRGGLIVYNWAVANPGKVAVIYGDAPVMDLKSWPGISQTILDCYGFKDEEETRAFAGNPLDNLAPL